METKKKHTHTELYKKETTYVTHALRENCVLVHLMFCVFRITATEHYAAALGDTRTVSVTKRVVKNTKKKEKYQARIC